MFRVEEPHSHQPMIIQVEVQGKQLSMELDTGAAVSINSSITKQQMFPAEQLLSTSNILTTHTGEQMAVAGRMEVEVRCDGKGSRLFLYVVEGDGPSLLGRDWLRVLKLNWKSIKVAAVEKGQQKVEALRWIHTGYATQRSATQRLKMQFTYYATQHIVERKASQRNAATSAKSYFLRKFHYYSALLIDKYGRRTVGYRG